MRIRIRIKKNTEPKQCLSVSVDMKLMICPVENLLRFALDTLTVFLNNHQLLYIVFLKTYRNKTYLTESKPSFVWKLWGHKNSYSLFKASDLGKINRRRIKLKITVWKIKKRRKNKIRVNFNCEVHTVTNFFMLFRYWPVYCGADGCSHFNSQLVHKHVEMATSHGSKERRQGLNSKSKQIKYQQITTTW